MRCSSCAPYEFRDSQVRCGRRKRSRITGVARGVSGEVMLNLILPGYPHLDMSASLNNATSGG